MKKTKFKVNDRILPVKHYEWPLAYVYEIEEILNKDYEYVIRQSGNGEGVATAKYSIYSVDRNFILYDKAAKILYGNK